MTQIVTPHAHPFRDIPVDLLRGLAITIMVGANLIPYLLAPPAPFWLRLVSSVAAPLFIFISGMMVALSCRTKHYTLSYFLLRGGFVIGIAAFLDLFVMGFVPFIDTDVLYLIGISLPLAYLFLSLGKRTRLAILIGILIAAFLLRGIVGYSSLPIMIPASSLPIMIPASSLPIMIPASSLPIMIPASSLLHGGMLPDIFAVLSQWFIDGWFPIFPWLFIALLGAQAGMFRWHEGTIISFAQRKLAILAVSVLAIGSIVWFLVPGPLLTRLGYVELFYPPATGFLLFITGLIFCLFIIADTLPITWRGFDPIRALGECSLAIYILHMVIITRVIEPFELQVPLYVFLAGYLLLITGMIVTAYLLRYARKKIRTRSFMVRTLIGG